MRAKTVILKEERIFDFIWFFILLIIFGVLLFPFEGYFKNEIYNKAVDFFVAFIFYSTLHISRRVFIKNEYLVKGIVFSVFILNKRKIPVSEIKDVVMTQDLENYFVISAIRNDNSKFIIKKIPNRNPALKELDIIRKHLNLN